MTDNQHTKPSLEEDSNTDSTNKNDDMKLRRKLVNDFTPTLINQMKVFLRIRPLTTKETDAEECLIVETGHSVLLKAPQQSATFRNNASNDSKMKQRFTFNRVFGGCVNQKLFFDGAVLGTVSEFLNGNNCLIFAYGTTNSGKTFTVQGTAAQPGIIPLAIDVIFNSVSDRLDNILNLRPLNASNVEQLMPKQVRDLSVLKNSLLQGTDEFFTSCSSLNSVESESVSEVSVRSGNETSELSIHESNNFRFRMWVSFAEIYNENIYDLLDVNPEKRIKLRLSLDRSGNNFIKGLQIIPVQSPKEARQLLYLGRKNLHIASTKLNQSSSRSHCIYTVYMVRVVDTLDPQQAMINSLSFCDLAGSERVVKTQNTGERLKEAGKINTSLMVFGRCIEALRATQNLKERPLIPFRDSKLTQLFQFFFNGKGRASMIVNVSPNVEMFDDTINVLRVSATAKQVVTSDQLDKTFLNATSSMRLTDLWAKSHQRWSSFSRGRDIPGKMSIVTQKEDSAIAEENEQLIVDDTLEEEPDVQELVDMFIDLEGKYNSLVDDYNELETKLRTEISQEFQSHFVSMEKTWEARVVEARESAEEVMEARLALLKKSIYGRRASTSQEDDSFDEMDSSDEEDVDQQTLMATLDAVQNELEVIKKDRDRFERQVQEMKLEFEDTNTKLNTLEIQSKGFKEQHQEMFVLKNQISELNVESEAKLLQKENKIKTLEENISTQLCEANEHKLIIKGLQEELLKVNQDQLSELKSKISHEQMSLKESLTKAEAYYSLEKTRADECELSCKNAEIVHKSEINQMTTCLEKMGTVLFEKDAEIEQQIQKCLTISQELEFSQKQNKILIENSEQFVAALAKIKKLEETVCKKDTEINVLKTRIIARECKDNSTDFKLPINRSSRRRKPAKENTIPKDDDSDNSLISSQSADSLSKNPDHTKVSLDVGLLQYVKQSPPVLAARNAIGSLIGSVTSLEDTHLDDTIPSTAEKSQRRFRRRLYKDDSGQTLECSPPKQVVIDSSAHTIVTRQLRSKGKK